MSNDAALEDAALSIVCPRCEAVAGEVCHTSVGLPRSVHRRRTAAYLETLRLDAGAHLDDA